MYVKINFMLLTFFYFVTLVTSKNCFWNSKNHYTSFSSKTPYNNERGDIRDSLIKLKGCEPISVWSLIRHGKRTPGTDYAGNMMEAITLKDVIAISHEKGESDLCAQDVENLYNWKPDPELFNNTHSLSKEGYLEVFGIARRIKKAFKELLMNLEDGSYIIRSAFGHWVEDGVESFVKGMSDKPLLVENSNPHYDIIAPHESCNKYMKEVKNNSATYNEANKYQSSEEYIAAKERIQKKIGVDYNLTNAQIIALYDLCRYTWSGIDNKESPWCALFSLEDLKVMEYHGDLRHYYRNGPGSSINHYFGQVVLADLYQIFSNAKKGEVKKLTAYFTHATVMDMAYTALGWYNDKMPLTSAFRDPNRKWRSSKLSVFAGNLIAVLHRCLQENKEHFKVVFYLNEEPVTSICEKGVCSWQEFENKLKPFQNTTLSFCDA
ncbi:unnamed protein product, partial [Brenthis ino]